MSEQNGNGNGIGKGRHPASLKAIEPHKLKPGHNRPGPGNPLAKQCNELRAELVNAVTRDDVKKIARKLVKKAKAGDIAASHEVFDRIFGKAQASIDITTAGRPLYVKAVMDVTAEEL